MKVTFGALLKSHNSLRTDKDDLGRANILGVPFCTLGFDKSKTNDNVSGLTPEIQKALFLTGYTCNSMKKIVI